jgi:predicted CoA-binding protein
MSEKSVAQKLLIRQDYTVLLVNAPKGYKDTLGKLPKGAKVVSKSSTPVDFIQIFAATKAEMTELFRKVKSLLKEEGLLWVTYPKAGQLDTDLKREVVWECGQTVGMRPVSQIAVDHVWNPRAFGLCQE